MDISNGMASILGQIKERDKKGENLSESGLNALLYCDDCKNLSPKEHEQTDDKVHHFCSYFNVRMYHSGHHPHIERPEDCMGYEQEI